MIWQVGRGGRGERERETGRGEDGEVVGERNREREGEHIHHFILN